jgi:hypothetical protein
MDSPFESFGTEVARDEPNNRVQWPPDRNEQVLPQLILFAYFSHRRDIPSTWQRTRLLDWRPGLDDALKYIFQTGNKEPPQPFETTSSSLQPEADKSLSAPENSLARWRSEREFRACLWLNNIRMWRDGVETKFRMECNYEVGWTPPPVDSLDMRPNFPNLVHGYSRGRGDVKPRPVKAVFHRAGVHIHIDVGFRIDKWWINIGSYFTFGRGVPYMRMILDLDVRSAGNHRVFFNGSYIPTQIYQIGNDPLKPYDMIEHIGGFYNVKNALGVGRNKRAPKRPDDPRNYERYIL